MSRRDNQARRCATCQMHTSLCVCPLTPSLATRTRLLLLVHYKEARKPTNTGQLAARCVANSQVQIVGDRSRPLSLPLVQKDEQPVLLFSAVDAVPLRDLYARDRRVLLIVPDGNWRQASKMRQRVPGLATVPCAVLPSQIPTAYRLRAEPVPGGLATMEAIAHALGLLEGEPVQQAMLSVFRTMVERTLWLRGALSTDEVTGGIPHEAQLLDPRGGGPLP